ncbi:MAG: hypothetical protein GX594_02580 [Pirellulaceae bacterium]|nr:hypothetical protein [Pirellulaceae bacterium]
MVIAVVVGVYAVAHESTWEASQALIVRNEAFSTEKTPGKFSHPEEMKTIQETILEIARGRGVLKAALIEVGPPARYDSPESWPTDEDIEEVRKNVKLAPPKGAEFGKTEVFYLNVKTKDRDRSVALNEAIFKQLGGRFMRLRDAKAESMIDELTKTVRLAKNDLDEATSGLAAIERGLGSDLAELRAMQEMPSSDSALRRSAEEIRAQLRETASTEKLNRELLAVIVEAQGDPKRLTSAPNHLLKTHDSLRRLKGGLIDAQLKTASLLGTMSEAHPKVRAAQSTEKEISNDLHGELAAVRHGIEVELRLGEQRRELLETQLTNTDRRLRKLTEARAEYANQTASVGNRAVLLERAEANLAEARAARASAKATSLISPIDAPEAGIRPVGPGRGVIALCGVAGGLLVGFGLVFLVVPAGAAEPVRSTPAVNGGSDNAIAARRPAANGSLNIPGSATGTNGRFTVKHALQMLAN